MPDADDVVAVFDELAPEERARAAATMLLRSGVPVDVRFADAGDNGKGIRLAEAASLVALVGVFFYTALRVAYGVFYDRLDATPEDVGLGYQQILAQSVGALAMLLLAAAVGIVVALWLARFLRTQLQEIAEKREQASAEPQAKPAAGDGAGAWLPIAVVIVLILVTGFLLGWGEVAIGTAPILLGTAGLALYERYQRMKDTRAAAYVRVGYIAAFIAVAFGAALVFLCLRAKSDAEAVRAGRAGRFELFGLPMTSWGATPARLMAASATQTSTSLPAGCVLYLGQAAGIVVVLDVASDPQRTLRFPVAQVVASLEECDPR